MIASFICKISLQDFFYETGALLQTQLFSKVVWENWKSMLRFFYLPNQIVEAGYGIEIQGLDFEKQIPITNDFYFIIAVANDGFPSLV